MPVFGRVTDDRGPVTVLVNGQGATVDGSGNFSVNLAMRKGFNMISVAAFDAAGNLDYAPMIAVYLLPSRGLTLTADRTTASVGEMIGFQVAITATQPLSDLLFSLILPSTGITNGVVSASPGRTEVNSLDSARVGITWQGDVAAGQPITVTVRGRTVVTGSLAATGIVGWGWGVSLRN